MSKHEPFQGTADNARLFGVRYAFIFRCGLFDQRLQFTALIHLDNDIAAANQLTLTPQEFSVAELRAAAESAGRTLRQRTTLYKLIDPTTPGREALTSVA